MKKKVLMILAAILLLNAFGSKVYADEKKTYTVTVSAGLHGMLVDEKGNKTKQITVEIGADEGWMWNPNDYEIKEENIDENYYFMGYHIAGIEGVVGAQTITHDIVFVASYGVENNLVKYYVNYVDEDGKGIGPVRKVYKGNVGDKPVIAYIHINGYAPLVENYTVTLKEDETIELTFIYRRVKSNAGTIIIEEEYEGGGNGSVGNQQASSTETTEPEATEAPIELVDVDETNVPEAESGEAQNSNESKNEDKKDGSFLQNYALPIVGGSLFLLLLLLLLLRRRHKEDE